MPKAKKVSENTVSTSEKAVKAKVATKEVAKKVVAKASKVTRRPKVEVVEENFVEMSEFTSNHSEKTPKVKISRNQLLVMSGLVILIGVGLFYLYKFLIIAWVDSTPVTRFTYYSELDKRFGPEILDQLLSENLINSEADIRNATASNEEIDAEVKKVETEIGGSDQLQQALQTRGLTMSDWRKQLRYQILIKKMFGGNINVTDDELNKFFESNKDRYPTVDDKLKAQVKEMLTEDKINKAFGDWLTQAKSSNRIIRVGQ